MRHNPERNFFSPLSSVVNTTFHNILILTLINIYQSFQNSLTLVSLKQNSVNKNVRGPLWSISVPQFNVTIVQTTVRLKNLNYTANTYTAMLPFCLQYIQLVPF